MLSNLQLIVSVSHFAFPIQDFKIVPHEVVILSSKNGKMQDSPAKWGMPGQHIMPRPTQKMTELKLKLFIEKCFLFIVYFKKMFFMAVFLLMVFFWRNFKWRIF